MQINHTYLTTIAGVRMFEHGKYGDEHPIVALVNGVYVSTGDYDIPSAEDVLTYEKEWEAL